MTRARKCRALLLVAGVVALVVMLRWALRAPLTPEFDRILYGAYEGARVRDLRSGARGTYRFHDREGKPIMAPDFGLSDDHGAVWSEADSALLVWSRDGDKSWLPVSLPVGSRVRNVVVHKTEICLVLRGGAAGLLFVPSTEPTKFRTRTDLVDCRWATQGWAVLDKNGRFWLLSGNDQRPIVAPAVGRDVGDWDYAASFDSIAMTVSRTRTRVVVDSHVRQFRAPFYTFAGAVTAVTGSRLVAVEAAQLYSTGVQLWLWSPESGRSCRGGDGEDVIYHPVMVATPELLELLEVAATPYVG